MNDVSFVQNTQESPSGTLFLGFDVGLKRIGVAVGQKITATASPLPVLRTEHGEPPWETIAQLIHAWRPTALIVGMPIDVNPAKKAVVPLIEHFVAQLQKRYHLPVHIIDERLTTKEARARVFAKGGYKALQEIDIDGVAAMLILEEWMSLQ